MDYSQQSQQPQRVWPTALKQQQQQSAPFQVPSPVSAGSYFFPGQPTQQPAPQTSPCADSRPNTSGLTLNLTGLSVASPPSLSPIGPHQQGQLHLLHAHHALPHQTPSPMTPVSPPNMSHLSSQPQFTYNFDDGGLTPDPLLTQRRPSSASHSVSPSELAVQKSVPRKRSLTNAAPSASTASHSIHHSQSHSFSSAQGLPHIITTTSNSPPLPTSPTSSPPSRPSHSHSHSLSHSHSHSSLSHTSLSPQRSLPHLEINPALTSPYDDVDSAGPFSGIGEDVSDDDFGSPSGSFSASVPFAGSNPKAPASSGQGQNSTTKPVATNNFVTKLYHMINDAKSQHFISWTELGTSFVVTNVGEFSRSILGSHFKHNNFSSFVRQLNMYGFHKINRTPRAQRTTSSSQSWEFSHPKFLRGRADLLEAIKRKALEPDPRERSRVELPGEVARLLTDLREENNALWREIRSLGSRIPQLASPTAGHGSVTTNFVGSSQCQILPQIGLGGGHVLTHSRSSSNLGDDGERGDWEEDDAMNASVTSGPMTGPGALGGTQGGEEWDPQSSRFDFMAGLNVPGFTPNAFGAVSGDEDWRRWAQGEIISERKRVQRLVGVVKALVDMSGKGGASSVPTVSGGVEGEIDGFPPSVLQELHELSLSFDSSPSPLAIPSPSPSPSPNSLSRHPQSPNIYITSPTSPSPYTTAHKRSPSRESQTHASASHTIHPTLSISTGPSQFSPYTPSPSPTTSDFVPGFFRGQGPTRGSPLGVRIPRQPNITLTLEPDDAGHVEKRARTDGKDSSGEEMDIVPNEGDDVKLASPISMTGSSPTTGSKVGMRSRSDSAPMWEAGGGLSANWTGRGRSGSSLGQ